MPEIETANSGSKGGRAERLKDLTAWINGDELKIVLMSGGKNDTGDMCSFSNSSGEAGRLVERDVTLDCRGAGRRP